MQNNPCTPSLVALFAALLCLNAAAEPQQAKPAGSRPQAVALASVGTAFAIGDPIGVVQAGPDCRSSTTREWSELLRHRVETELPIAFQEEMSKALSATRGRSRSAVGIEVKAIVNDLKVSVCNVGRGSWLGNLQVQVNWQVARHDTHRVVYETSTTGHFERAKAQTSVSTDSGLREAFAVSVRSLLADQRFASMLPLRDGQNLAARVVRDIAP